MNMTIKKTYSYNKGKGGSHILLSQNEALDHLEYGGFRQDIYFLREKNGRRGERGGERERETPYLASPSKFTHQISLSSLVGDKWMTRNTKTQIIMLKEPPL